MKKSMQELYNEYAKKYLPNNDKMHCLDVPELLQMGREQANDAGHPEDAIYYVCGAAFYAGFMKGYRCANYDRKKARKGK